MSNDPAILRPAVFLDRDGTLNAAFVRADGTPLPPANVEQLMLLPGVPEACTRLHQGGYALVVVTNQPDVGRGTRTRDAVEAMHARLRELIPAIDRIEVSYDAEDGPSAPRRKPAPGMVLEAAAAMGLDLTRSWLVGDRWRDVECGRRAGTRTILIGEGYNEHFPSRPDHQVAGMSEAADLILNL